MMLLLALGSSLALAGDGVPLDPALPVHGSAWLASATAWDLPPQHPEYLTEEVEELRCGLDLVVQPDGSHQAQVQACPETMQAEALDAAGRWSFAAAEQEGPTTVRLTYVLRYSSALGALTLHAEVDPGAQAALDGVEGKPGLRLVHEATPLKPLETKVPGKARKAGQGEATCQLRARVGTSGKVLETAVIECPEALAVDASKRVAKARFSPTRIDGLRQEDVVDVAVRYLP